jgi:hypothetical protein
VRHLRTQKSKTSTGKYPDTGVEETARYVNGLGGSVEREPGVVGVRRRPVGRLLVGQPEKVVVEAFVSSTVREIDDHLKSKWRSLSKRNVLLNARAFFVFPWGGIHGPITKEEENLPHARTHDQSL